MKPKIGDLVHYVLPCCSDDHRIRPNAMGEHRPAWAVNARADGRLVLWVLLDEFDAVGGESFATVVGAVQDEVEKRPDTWHFPEEEE
jgi:hypothetical protein